MFAVATFVVVIRSHVAHFRALFGVSAFAAKYVRSLREIMPKYDAWSDKWSTGAPKAVRFLTNNVFLNTDFSDMLRGVNQTW